MENCIQNFVPKQTTLLETRKKIIMAFNRLKSRVKIFLKNLFKLKSPQIHYIYFKNVSLIYFNHNDRFFPIKMYVNLNKMFLIKT